MNGLVGDEDLAYFGRGVLRLRWDWTYQGFGELSLMAILVTHLGFTGRPATHTLHHEKVSVLSRAKELR